MRWDCASRDTYNARISTRASQRCPVEVDHDGLLVVRILVKVPPIVLRQRPACSRAPRKHNISPYALNFSARARRAGSTPSAAALAKNARSVSTRKLSRETMSTKKSVGVSLS